MLLCVIDDSLQLQIAVDDAVVIDICWRPLPALFSAGELHHANALHGLFQLCFRYHPISIGLHAIKPLAEFLHCHLLPWFRVVDGPAAFCLNKERAEIPL